ncbi:MAG: EthD domain-containing protein [Gammaproteobacteria bacterium]
MIRIAFALRRKAGMSREEFQDYWQNVHGPLVARHSTTLKIHRYIQLHTLEDPINDALAEARGGMEPIYDGMAELWWKDEDALNAFSTEAGAAAGAELLEDENKFIDLPNSPLWFAYELPQVNPSEYIVAHEHSPLVKLIFPLRSLSSMSDEACQWYWRSNHGPIIRGVAPGFRMRRYLQVHYFKHPLEEALSAARGTKVPPYLGHAEAWFDRADLMSMANVPEATRAMEIAIEDEAKFIDFKRSTMWIGKERVFIDRR